VNIAVSLDQDLIKTAKSYSVVQDRSVPKQIEHWAKIGRIAEDNPDLCYNTIIEILLGLEDKKSNNIEKYKKGIL